MCTDIGLSSSSERFSKAVRWLVNETKFDETKLKNELREKQEELRKVSKEKTIVRAGKTVRVYPTKEMELEWTIEPLNKKLRMKYSCSEVEAFYVLKKLDSKLVDEFVSVAEDNAFWEDAHDHIFDCPHTLWFLKNVGLGDNPYFHAELDNLIRQQSIEGFIHSNAFHHSGPLRVLVATKPESEVLNNAVNYWLKNWKDLSFQPGTIAVGVLALTELDIEEYSNAIRKEIDYLKSFQNENGSWGTFLRKPYSKQGDIIGTSFALWAISRVDGIEDSAAQNGLEWLTGKQQENGSWGNNTGIALLGLLAMGEGPKLALELMNNKFIKLKQGLRRQKPIFIHTSPLFQGSLHVREIYDKVSYMLHKAQKEIRIASPFVDMLYEELINLKQANPNLIVKIITRPKKEVEGMRDRIARNVIDLLDIATKGNVVQSTLIHSRIVIIDNKEVLVSSADLTRDQLFDEFNAGIWTSDKDAVKKAIIFFENLFRLEKEKTQTQA